MTIGTATLKTAGLQSKAAATTNKKKAAIKKKSLSLKEKLKQEIEELKRKKKLAEEERLRAKERKQLLKKQCAERAASNAVSNASDDSLMRHCSKKEYCDKHNNEKSPSSKADASSSKLTESENKITAISPDAKSHASQVEKENSCQISHRKEERTAPHREVFKMTDLLNRNAVKETEKGKFEAEPVFQQTDQNTQRTRLDQLPQEKKILTLHIPIDQSISSECVLNPIRLPLMAPVPVCANEGQQNVTETESNEDDPRQTEALCIHDDELVKQNGDEASPIDSEVKPKIEENRNDNAPSNSTRQIVSQQEFNAHAEGKISDKSSTDALFGKQNELHFSQTMYHDYTGYPRYKSYPPYMSFPPYMSYPPYMAYPPYTSFTPYMACQPYLSRPPSIGFDYTEIYNASPSHLPPLANDTIWNSVANQKSAESFESNYGTGNVEFGVAAEASRNANENNANSWGREEIEVRDPSLSVVRRPFDDGLVNRLVSASDINNTTPELSSDEKGTYARFTHNTERGFAIKAIDGDVPTLWAHESLEILPEHDCKKLSPYHVFDSLGKYEMKTKSPNIAESEMNPPAHGNIVDSDPNAKDYFYSQTPDEEVNNGVPAVLAPGDTLEVVRESNSIGENTASELSRITANLSGYPFGPSIYPPATYTDFLGYSSCSQFPPLGPSGFPWKYPEPYLQLQPYPGAPYPLCSHGSQEVTTNTRAGVSTLKRALPCYRSAENSPSNNFPAKKLLVSNDARDGSENIARPDKQARFRYKFRNTSLLSEKILRHPSPFSKTHAPMQHPIVLVKGPEKSFGVTVSIAVESALVQIPQEELAEPVISKGLGEKEPPKRKRKRRRVFFVVMTVIDASVQNERKKLLRSSNAENTEKHHDEEEEKSWQDSNLLQRGDVVLSISGHSIAGLTFPAACELFHSCTEVGTDGMIQCPMVVARRKEAHKKPDPIRVEKDSPAKIDARLPLKQCDFLVYAVSIVKAVLDSTHRLVGNNLSDEDLNCQIAIIDPTLSKIPLSFLNGGWRSIAEDIRRLIQENARRYWESLKLTKQSKDYDDDPHHMVYSDARLASLRAAPRPLNGGCKCGSQTHHYVHAPQCFLYGRLRALDANTFEETDATTDNRDTSLSKPLIGDLNAVEKAFTDRLKRQKQEEEEETAEAIFVDRMETIQLFQCNQAIFAPTLEAIVLSAVVEIGLKFRDCAFAPNIYECPTEKEPSHKTIFDAREEIDSDDDDSDDLPLALLGNKDVKGKVGDASERRRVRSLLRCHFLAKLLRHISEKWGHIYREPSHLEYAWRWEVFHGQNSIKGSTWRAGTRNPRNEDSLSLENVRFLLDDETISGLEKQDDENAYFKAIKALAYILSPEQTGVCDELLALLSTNVLVVDEERGLPVLASDWYSRVDAMLLNDMHSRWGAAVDSVGKYGIIDEVRTLSDHWERTDKGWLLKEEDDLVFLSDELEEWREAFEEKHESHLEDAEGIGKFY